MGVLCLLRWFGHFIALGVYTLLDATVRPLAQRSKSFRVRRCAFRLPFVAALALQHGQRERDNGETVSTGGHEAEPGWDSCQTAALDCAEAKAGTLT